MRGCSRYGDPIFSHSGAVGSGLTFASKNLWLTPMSPPRDDGRGNAAASAMNCVKCNGSRERASKTDRPRSGHEHDRFGIPTVWCRRRAGWPGRHDVRPLALAILPWLGAGRPRGLLRLPIGVARASCCAAEAGAGHGRAPAAEGGGRVVPPSFPGPTHPRRCQIQAPVVQQGHAGAGALERADPVIGVAALAGRTWLHLTRCPVGQLEPCAGYRIQRKALIFASSFSESRKPPSGMRLSAAGNLRSGGGKSLLTIPVQCRPSPLHPFRSNTLPSDLATPIHGTSRDGLLHWLDRRSRDAGFERRNARPDRQGSARGLCRALRRTADHRRPGRIAAAPAPDGAGSASGRLRRGPSRPKHGSPIPTASVWPGAVAA